MKITLINLIILSLASFRLTRLIVFDKVTEFIREPFFDEVQEENSEGQMEIYYLPKQGRIKGFFGELLSCYWCTGIWCATVIVVFYYLFPGCAAPICLILAVSGIASILETIVQYYVEK